MVRGSVVYAAIAVTVRLEAPPASQLANQRASQLDREPHIFTAINTNEGLINRYTNAYLADEEVTS